MATTSAAPEVTVSPELTAWATWLRAGMIAGLAALLLAGRSLVHLPIPLVPIVAIAIAASLYNAALAVAAWHARERPEPAGDRFRARILYIGSFLDTIAMALLVWFTGGLISPWLYFFLATSVVSSAILPPPYARIMTAANAAAALLVVLLPVLDGVPLPAALFQPNFWVQPGYAAIVGVSLIGVMVVTARAVSVPVESARAAARFQEGLAQIAMTLQRTEAGAQEVLAVVCAHAHEWFRVDRTVISVLEGEELVNRAAEGFQRTQLLGRRTAVSDRESLDVEVLRRRSGFYVNHVERSAYSRRAAVTEFDDRAVLLVPVVGGLGVLGVLTMADRRHAARFTPVLMRQASILAAQAGIAIENARLLDRVREEAENVTALLLASERLTKSDDVPALLNELSRIAAEACGCARGATFLWDPVRQAFSVGSTFGTAPEVAAALRQAEWTRGSTPLIERVLAGETFVVSAEDAARALPAALRTVPLGVSAVVPLKTEHTVQGVITVSYLEAGRDFSGEQLWMLRGIARYAALAIERARLMAQERDAARAAEALVSLGRELSATLDRREVLARLPQMAAEAAGGDFALLSFWDRAAKNIHVVGAYGFSAEATDALLHLTLDAPEPAFTEEFMRQRSFEVQSPQPLPNLPAGLMEQWGVSSILSVYIGPVDERIGSLTVGYRQRTGPFSAAQRRLLSGIAQHATVVLENTRLVEDLRRASRLKSDFLSIVSHELRTPLSAIIGYTDLLRELALGPLQPEQLEIMHIMAKKGQQLLELINTTLDLTRLEARQTHLSVSEFSLGDVLVEIRQELADQVPARVDFSCTADPQLSLLRGDRAKLKTVIKNLAHNALKFTPSGRVDVRAQPAARPAHVEVVVRDTGIGIAAENLKAIFEMFRQVEPAMTRHFAGVGLGLYIVQRLLELMQGAIRVESEPQKGSVFSVTLPARLP
jgi:signal transduction histidine kinase